MPLLSYAQQRHTWSQLSVPELGEAEVNSMVIDRYGALWAGTNKGALRFDGAVTERYVNDPNDPNSLPIDVVNQVTKDGSGNVWIATFGGVVMIDPATGRRRRVLFQDDEQEPRSVECTTLAQAREGGLWAYCLGAGIYRLMQGDSVFRNVIPANDRGAYAVGGWEDPLGNLWYTNKNELICFDTRSRTHQKYAFKPDGAEAPVKTLLLKVMPDQVGSNGLWCTSWGLGMVHFDLKTRSFDRYFVQRKPMSDLRNIVSSALQLDQDHWYVVLDRDLFLLDTRSGSWISVQGQDSNASISLLELGQGSMLVGGAGQLNVMNGPIDEFKPMHGALVHPNIHVCPAKDGNGYWAVRYYEDRMLMRLDSVGHVLHQMALPERGRPYEAFQVLQDRSGKVWLATTIGLMALDPDAQRLENVPLKISGHVADRISISSMAEMQDGLWCCTGLGLIRIDKDGVQHHIPCEDPFTGAPTYPIMIKEMDQDRSIVVMDPTAPMILDHTTMKIAPMQVDPEYRNEMALVRGAALQANGQLILTTQGQGIIRVSPTSDHARYEITRRWYLKDRPTFSESTTVRGGSTWFTSDRGLFILDPQSNILHRVDPLHGAPERLSGQVLQLTNDRLLLSGAKYYIASSTFDPQRPTPALLIRSIVASGSSIHTTSADPITLAHNANDIAFTFGAVSMLDGHAIDYSYCIAVNDEVGPWNELGSKRSLNLVGLSPGNYHLQIRAAGVSAEPVTTSLTFIVEPAWWGTWWARTLFIGSGVLLVLGATRLLVTQRLKRRVKELEREREIEMVRTRISRDIHDGIGSGLTKITLLSRQLEAEVGPRAERIAKASADLVSELGEIVWTVDPKNDDYASFAAYVRNMLGKQFEDIPQELDLQVAMGSMDASIALSPEVKRNALLMLKEAVSNALKYADANVIKVVLSLSPHGLSLEVVDNGKGFDPQNIRTGANGLNNFRKRAEALGGTMFLQSDGSGTTVSLYVPLPSTNM